MERQEIFDKVEEIWDMCQERNIGSNEAELDFRETVADWIYGQLSPSKPLIFCENDFSTCIYQSFDRCTLNGGCSWQRK